MRFGLQLRTDDPLDVGPQARRAEELGFDIVLVADHVGSDWGPLPSLLAAAAATQRIHVGTYVLNAWLHHPLLLARDVATIDRLSGGRFQLGLGAGHTAAEFRAAGVPFLPAAERKAHLADVVEIVRALLDGETVTRRTARFDLVGASLGPARPIRRVPIMVGGSGPGLLGHAAAHADVVGFTGLGRTLPDGHHHSVRFAPAVLDEDVALVRRAAAGRDVVLDVLVQHVEITDDREAAARRLSEQIEDLTVQDALDTPFLALGTHDEIADQVRAAEARWGIGSMVVRDAEAFAPVVARSRTVDER